MGDYVTGAKFGQPQAPKQPSIAPDSAQSKTFIKILYGLSEGEIAGLANGYKSLFLEDTPLHDDNGNPTVKNVTVDYRAGTNDQTYIDGFPDVRNEVAIGVALKANAPFIRSFSNRDIDAVDVRLTWGALRKQDKDGNVTGTTVEYAIDVQTDGRGYVEVLRESVTAKTSANYTRQRRIDLPRADNGWQLRVRRITPDSTSDLLQDAMQVEAMTEVIDLKMRYPNTALLGLQYDAESFNNVAKIAAECKGKIIKVPSNYDAENRTYNGMWNGTFKQAYSNNPAWIYYDICTNDRYGLGNRLSQFMLDKWSLYRLAQYCDEQVDNGEGGLEPRFTLNVYLQSADDAYAILSRIAGVFRAISYWDGERIVCDADIPQDTYFSYSMANVIDGHFEYTGTRARDRHTVVKVAWDNPRNRYKTEYEFVRDEAAISKLGVRILDLEAWGCTSRGQAQRAGLWALKSEQLETRQVSFKVGLDGYIPLPGKVIEVSDALFAGRANGGRVSAISANGLTVTLDRDVTVRAGDTLVINDNSGKSQRRSVLSIVGRVVTVSSAFSNIEAQNVWVLDAQDLATMKFRVLSVTQDDKHQFTIKAIQYEPKKYAAIDTGAYVDTVPISIINPTVQDAVSTVVITSENRVEQGINITALVISWTQAQGATKYLVEWRKDDGNWIRLPLTGSVSAEVQGVYAGNYEARVTAISAFDMSSQPTYSALTPITGKVGKPPKVASISATGLLFAMRIDWTFPQGATDTAYTEVQVSPDGVSNIAALGQYAYPTNTATINGLQGKLTQFYRARLIDRIGNVGDWSNWVSGTTTSDAKAVLDILSGQITESQLHKDLSSKVDKIDPLSLTVDSLDRWINPEMAGSTNHLSGASGLAGVLSEQDARLEAIAKTAQAINQDVTEKIGNIKTAFESADAQVKSEIEGTVATKISGIKTAFEDADKQVKTDINNVIDTRFTNYNNEILKADNAVRQAIATEYQNHITTLIEAPNGINEKITKSTDGLVTYLKTYKDSNGKYIGGVVDEVTTKIGENGTLVTKLDGVFAAQNPEMAGSQNDLAGSGNLAGVWSEMSARIEGDLKEAKRTDTLIAQTSDDIKAYARSEVKASSDKTSARIDGIDLLTAQVGGKVANLYTAVGLEVAADGTVTARKLEALDAKYGGDGTPEKLGIIADEKKLTLAREKALAEKFDGVFLQINPEMAGASTVDEEEYDEKTGKYVTKTVTYYAGSTKDKKGQDKYVGSWSTKSALIEGDMYQASRTDTVVAKAKQDVQAFAQQEIKVVADANSATLKALDLYKVENKKSYAGLVNALDLEVKADGTAVAHKLEALDIKYGGDGDQKRGLIFDEQDARIKADSSLLTKITGVYQQVNPEMAGSQNDLAGYDHTLDEKGAKQFKYVGSWSEMSARIEGDMYEASRTDTVIAQAKNDVKAYADEKVKVVADDNSATLKALNLYKVENKKSYAGLVSALDLQVKDDGTTVANKLDLLDVKYGGDGTPQKIGLIAQEAKIRADADAILTTKFTGVYAQLNPEMAGSENDKAGFDHAVDEKGEKQYRYVGSWSEMSARIEGDLNEAKRTDTVIAQATNDVKAFARSEVQATAQGLDTRLVKTEQSAATNGQSIAALTEALDLIVTEDGAYAKKITDLDLKYGGDGTETNRGLVFSEQDARVTADKSIVKKLDGVFAELDPEMAGASTVQKDVFDEKTGLYKKVDVTYYAGADVDNEGKRKYSGSWSERSATIEENLALSKKIDATVAKLGETQAAIVTESMARATDKEAMAKRVDTVQSTLNGHTASIKTQQESIDGLNTKYTLKLDVNGYVSGFGMANDGKTSDFIVNADTFAIAAPGSTNYAFNYKATAETLPNGTVIPAGLYLDSAVIGSIDAGKIKADKLSAVSANLGEITAGSISVGNYTDENNTVQPNFKLDSNGNLTANNGTFRGNIYATKFFGEIDVTSLRKSAWMGGWRQYYSFDDNNWNHLAGADRFRYFTGSGDLYPSFGGLNINIGYRACDIGGIRLLINVNANEATTKYQMLYLVDDEASFILNGDYIAYADNRYGGRKNQEIQWNLRKGFNSLEIIIVNSGWAQLSMLLSGDIVDNYNVFFA